MFMDLKKKMRGRKMLFALFFGTLFIFILSMFGGDLREYFTPTYNLSELDEFDLKTGMKVRADIDVVFDCYCYEETTYSSSDTIRINSKEYYIPFQDKIIGMMCDDSFNIAMVDNNLEKMYAYYDGDDSALDNLSTITLEGYIREFDSESLTFYNEGKEWFGSEYEDRFLPYRFEVCQKVSSGSIIRFSIVAVIIFIPFAFFVVQTIWPPLPKEIKDYIAKIGNEEVARNTLETFYSHSNVIHDIHYSPEMIYANRNGKVVLIETKDILWIYPHSFRWSLNFVPIMLLHSVKFYLQDKKLLSISVGSQKAANEVIWTFNQFMPYVYYGYRDEIKHLFYQDFKKMLDTKEDCRNRFLEAKRQEEIERKAMIEKRKQQTIYRGN